MAEYHITFIRTTVIEAKNEKEAYDMAVEELNSENPETAFEILIEEE